MRSVTTLESCWRRAPSRDVNSPAPIGPPRRCAGRSSRCIAALWFLISPCLPRRPEHKGGVEGDIKYVKRNFLPRFREAEKERGRDTPDAGGLAEELERWNRESCDQHVVQKVGRTPLELFESEEAQALRPLPDDALGPGGVQGAERRSGLARAVRQSVLHRALPSDCKSGAKEPLMRF